VLGGIDGPLAATDAVPVTWEGVELAVRLMTGESEPQATQVLTVDLLLILSRARRAGSTSCILEVSTLMSLSFLVILMTLVASLAPVPDLEIRHPRFRALGHALCRAGLGQQYFAALAALHPMGALELGHPSKIFSCPRYLI
jgi:hypothetical protein